MSQPKPSNQPPRDGHQTVSDGAGRAKASVRLSRATHHNFGHDGHFSTDQLEIVQHQGRGEVWLSSTGTGTTRNRIAIPIEDIDAVVMCLLRSRAEITGELPSLQFLTLHHSNLDLSVASRIDFGRGIDIYFGGYSTQEAESGHGPPVFIELDDAGDPRVLVWEDITRGDPTAIASLSGARESPGQPLVETDTGAG